MNDEPLICEQCGTENPPDATFCLICGHDLHVQQAEPQPEAEPPDESPNPEQAISDLPELLRDLHSENASSSIRRSAVFQENGKEKPVSPSESGGQDVSSPAVGSSDWLEKIRRRAQEEEDAAGDLVKRVSARDQELEGVPEDMTKGEFEDWLSHIRQTARRDKFAPSIGSVEEPGGEDDIPNWLKKVRDNEAQEAEKEQAAATAALPGWIKEQHEAPVQAVSSEELTQKIRIISEIRGEPIPIIEVPAPEEPAEQPGQSKNEPPEVVEETPQQEEVQPVDELPVVEAPDEPLIVEPDTKIWQYISDNQPNEQVLEQRSRAEVLKTILTNEGRSVEVPALPEKKKTKLFRFLLAFLLLLAVCSPLFIGNTVFTAEGGLSGAGLAFYQQVEQTNSGDRVLLILDYPAGMSAEMELVSRPVLTHLVKKNVAISALSSQPEGVWLAPRLVEISGVEGLYTQITYLGYLPGGRLGLYNASQGESLEILNSLSYEAAQEPGVTLADFELMIIMVDSLQSARNWIELVAPGFDDKPVLMISTAQEAVMLLPYVDSAQLDGLISGLLDGSRYAVELGGTTQSAFIWRSYQAGLLLILGLILVGIITRLESTSADYATKESNT